MHFHFPEVAGKTARGCGMRLSNMRQKSLIPCLFSGFSAMLPAAHVSAAIEILGVTELQRRPAADALKDWGAAHRFAGSKDRAFVASLVFDALRQRASAQWLMDADDARSTMLGALRLARGLDDGAIAALFSGEAHAPAPLTETEHDRLARANLDKAPDHVRGNYPEWLAPHFTAAFGARAADEGAALAARAPLDLRANINKGDRAGAMKKLAHLNPEACVLSPVGLRIPLKPDGRGAPMDAEPAYVKGFVEIQDEGSQLAAFASGAQPGEQALDLCAGGGGKALAIAALMHNKGQVYAHDSDGRRLMPILPRIERAGVRNIQLRPPRGKEDVLKDLGGRCDLVFVDAPCTGTGAWRRSPDAKWRMRPGALELRVKDQDAVLASAARYVKPGGRIVYVTCSVLIDENEARVQAFLAAHANFRALDAAETTKLAMLPALEPFASPHGPGMRLTPLSAGTDGFYFAVLALA